MTDAGDDRHAPRGGFDGDPDAGAVLGGVEREELAHAATHEDGVHAAAAEEVDVAGEAVAVERAGGGKRRRGEGEHAA